ncbi:hypothetical protein [Paraburkholderia aromaticivorans]|uniref:hypothetical protein n=1 Tax=Paraburkholderia aromaticivorans TaxID=2026199 RepID=UPI0038B6E145
MATAEDQARIARKPESQVGIEIADLAILSTLVATVCKLDPAAMNSFSQSVHNSLRNAYSDPKAPEGLVKAIKDRVDNVVDLAKMISGT